MLRIYRRLIEDFWIFKEQLFYQRMSNYILITIYCTLLFDCIFFDTVE